MRKSYWLTKVIQDPETPNGYTTLAEHILATEHGKRDRVGDYSLVGQNVTNLMAHFVAKLPDGMKHNLDCVVGCFVTPDIEIMFEQSGMIKLPDNLGEIKLLKERHLPKSIRLFADTMPEFLEDVEEAKDYDNQYALRKFIDSRGL